MCPALRDHLALELQREMVVKAAQTAAEARATEAERAAAERTFEELRTRVLKLEASKAELEASKAELTTALRVTERGGAAQLMQQMHHLNETCWDTCITGSFSSSLSGREETCVTNCVERFVDTTLLITNRFAQLAQKMGAR